MKSLFLLLALSSVLYADIYSNGEVCECDSILVIHGIMGSTTEIPLVDEEIHGTVKVFNSGRLVAYTEYNQGQKDGLSIVYYEDGTELMRQYNVKGKEQSMDFFERN